MRVTCQRGSTTPADDRYIGGVAVKARSAYRFERRLQINEVLVVVERPGLIQDYRVVARDRGTGHGVCIRRRRRKADPQPRDVRQ